MSEPTTEELIDLCRMGELDGSDTLIRGLADRLESQQKEIEELQRQVSAYGQGNHDFCERIGKAIEALNYLSNCESDYSPEDIIAILKGEEE